MDVRVKKRFMVVAIVVVSLLIAVAAIPLMNAAQPYYQQYMWNKFFYELTMNDVQETRILLENDTEAVMTREETIELVDQLKQIHLGRIGSNQYKYYNVNVSNFRIIMTDGYEFVFGTSGSPFYYVLNRDQGHNGDYHVCESINALWTELNAKYCEAES